MMHEHSCAEVQDRLDAFHDGELSLDERAAIQNHLGECVACSLVSTEITNLGSCLRDLAAHMAGGVRLLMLEFLDWRDWHKTLLAAASGISIAVSLLFLLNLV